jgi:hypothetical protein
MVVKKKSSVNIEKNVKDLGKVFNEFGEAVSSIFKDSKLKSEAQKLGKNVVGTARTFANRFQDKEVKKQFKDVSKATTSFGKGVAKTAKPTIKKVKKEIAKRTARPVKKVVAKKPATKKTTTKKKATKKK